MIVVDSSVWIAQLRGSPSPAVERLEAIDDLSAIVVGDLVLLEVLQGVRDEAHAASIERALRRFHVMPMLDDEIAVAAARNFRRLRAGGITVRGAIDMIIATFCLARGFALLQEDRDFAHMAPAMGLRLV